MLKYYANTFIHSKIGSKILIYVFILIILVITNFVIFSYYQSQMAYLGNSINIAGKNRFLTSNLMFQISEYSFIEDNTKNSSKINSAINQLESNILVLRQGGNSIAGIDLKPLPREFLNDWNKIYQKWISLKTSIANNIIKADDERITRSEKSIDKVKETLPLLLETEALSLVDSSNILVTKLGDYLKSNSEYSLFIQGIFIILIIAVTAAFVLYLIRKISKPILSLNSAISEVARETLNVISQRKGKNHDDDELSVLSNSFDYMVNSIKNIKKQDELIKEIERANKELRYKDQLKNEFINVAAHEMKTPLQPIIAIAELLRQGGMNIEKDKELLDIIYRSAKRLMRLAEEILDVTRIESGSLFLKKEKFNLKEMITEILREYEQKIVENKKNIKLFYESYDNNNDEIIIDADRNRLSQVIYNLLDNAFKFTNQGSITVIVDKRKKDNNNNNNDNEILVSIKDTGTGIHPEILPKLFTKFATKSMTGGTGLGLFISKSIIEMHGGKIWATNNNEKDGTEEEGVGSTFTFSLPIKQ